MKLAWSRLNEPAWRRRFLIVACGLFLAGCAVSLWQQPDLLSSLHLAPAFLQVAIAIPLTIIANGLEFRLLARMLGVPLSSRQAIEVSVLGSAANLLPIPGAFLVRVAQLQAGGVRARVGASANVLVALLWIGVAFVYAGAWIAALARGGLGAGTAALGGASLLAAVLLGRSLGASPRIFVALLGNKIVIVLLESLRLWLSFQVLGVAASYAQASALVVASVVGSAVSLVPAGLGVRELLSAALAPVVGVAAAAGFMAAAVGRVLEVAVLASAAAWLARALAAREAQAP